MCPVGAVSKMTWRSFAPAAVWAKGPEHRDLLDARRAKVLFEHRSGVAAEALGPSEDLGGITGHLHVGVDPLDAQRLGQPGADRGRQVGGRVGGRQRYRLAPSGESHAER